MRESPPAPITRTRIPAPVIAVVSEVVMNLETHASLDNLFLHAGAPGDPPLGSKLTKAQEWLRRTNRDATVEPLQVLGQLIEPYMEADLESCSQDVREGRQKIESALQRTGLTYIRGGIVTTAAATPSRTLESMLRERDLVSVNAEFERALENTERDPRDAVCAACTVLESLCKIYIEDEGLEFPNKQDLQSVWNVVRKDLGFDPSEIEDRDLQEILSGLISTVKGIASLRTHASSAHAPGRRIYRIEPRHARLAVHAAHTLAGFVIECWDKKKAR